VNQLVPEYPEVQPALRVPAAHQSRQHRLHLLTRESQQPPRVLAPPDLQPVPLGLEPRAFQSVPAIHYFRALQVLPETLWSLEVHCLLEHLVNQLIRENRKIQDYLVSR